MLATCVNFERDTRRKYLGEVFTANRKYVRNINIGFRVRPTSVPQCRFSPYNTPKREERHRTRSENNDSNEATLNLVKSVLEERVDETLDELSQLKKAKSLESIVMENGKEVTFDNLGSELNRIGLNLPEVEIVSNCIEKLKVNE